MDLIRNVVKQLKASSEVGRKKISHNSNGNTKVVPMFSNLRSLSDGQATKVVKMNRVLAAA